VIPTETLLERRTDRRLERARRRAPPVFVTLTLAALPPTALYALTHPVPAVLALTVLAVLVVTRGQPERDEPA
jgi:hypothetical protein